MSQVTSESPQRDRDPGWECLLFASELTSQLALRQGALLALSTGEPMASAWDIDDPIEVLGEMMDKFSQILLNFQECMTPEELELALGAPGEKGDASEIGRLAINMGAIYGDLLDWSAQMKVARVEPRFKLVYLTAAELVEAPVKEIRTKIRAFSRDAAKVAEALKNGSDESFSIDMVIRIDLDYEVFGRLQQETEKALGTGPLFK